MTPCRSPPKKSRLKKPVADEAFDVDDSEPFDVEGVAADEMAQALETHKIAVDLLVTLAPLLQEPVPSNVVRAMNYFQNPGWGAPLVAGRGFRGKLSNIDVSSDLTITHINIDKSARVQTEITRAILAIPQPKASPQAKEDAPPPER